MAKFLVLLMSLTAAGSPGLLQQRSLIEQALDEPTKIKLEGITLEKAFEQVTRQTGVPIFMHEDVMAMIPHGGNTTVHATIANTTLRKGLTDLVAPLGMTFVVNDKTVEIVPKPALMCLGRRATWDELDTLYWLSRVQPGVNTDDMHALKGKVQFRSGQANGWPLLMQKIVDIGPGAGDEVLTLACEFFNWRWCVAGKQITVMTEIDYFRHQLELPIEMQVTNRPLFEAIQQVGSLIRVPVRVEAGALQTLAEDMRDNFTLKVRFQSAEETFDSIAAYTGLGWLIDQQGVVFYAAQPRVPTTEQIITINDKGEQVVQEVPAGQSAGGQSSHRDPVVGMIEVKLPNGQAVQWLVRESELPPGVKAVREKHLGEVFEILLDQAGDAAADTTTGKQPG